LLRSSSLIRSGIVAIAAIAAVVLIQWFIVHKSFQGNWTALFVAGDRLKRPPEIQEKEYVHKSSFGYDGQHYQVIAHDPWLSRHYDRFIDAPRFRYRRILMPGLAYLLAAGQSRYIDRAFFLVCWLLIGLGTFCLARLAVHEGRSPAWGLLFLAVPATLSTIERMTPDMGAAALLLVVLLAIREERWTAAWLALAASALSKETGILVIVAAVVWLVRDRKLRLAATIATSVLPAIIWNLYLQWHTAPEHGFAPLGFITPFFASFAWPGSFGTAGAFRIASMAAVLVLLWTTGRTLMLGFQNRFRTLALLLGSLFAVLLLFSQSPLIWDDANSFARVNSPLLVCLLAATWKRGLGQSVAAIVVVASPLALELTDNVLKAWLAPTPSSHLVFIPVAPCRVVDMSLPAGSSRAVRIADSTCHLPNSALAYSLDVRAVPRGGLGYLSVWPAGLQQPSISTLNSTDGHPVSNAVITGAGRNGGISVFVSDAAEVSIDVNGFFAPAEVAHGFAFYPLTPCRAVDTRRSVAIDAGKTRNFPIQSSPCGIPNTAEAYSFNLTVLPRGKLDWLKSWPAGQTQPVLASLDSPDGRAVSKAAIIPAGQDGAVSITVSNEADVIIDVNGYFAAPGSSGATYLNTLTPCRVVDTRGTETGTRMTQSLSLGKTQDLQILQSSCGIPSTAQAYAFNTTMLPIGPLEYFTMWPTGMPRPAVATLSLIAVPIAANAAIVRAGANGSISVFATGPTNLLLDISGYFAP